MAVKYNRFSSLLQRKFIFEKLWRIEEIAAKMNVPTGTLYKWIEGQANVPVDIVATLYSATKDPDFLNFILNDTDTRAVPREAAAGNRSVVDETFDAVAAHGDMVQEIHEAIKDRRISELEARSIEAKINKEIKELEELRQAVKSKDLTGARHD